jgi:hypothetical protein
MHPISLVISEMAATLVTADHVITARTKPA